MLNNFNPISGKGVFLFPALQSIVATRPLGLGRALRLLQLRNGSVQGLGTGLAASAFHEGRIA